LVLAMSLLERDSKLSAPQTDHLSIEHENDAILATSSGRKPSTCEAKNVPGPLSPRCNAREQVESVTNAGFN
jgi:hypothetical protein